MSDNLKIKSVLLFILLTGSCVYDPPIKGKELIIHNQSREPLIILDSLTGRAWQLFDTARVNGRRYISRRPNYMTEYSICQKFYTANYISDLKKKKIDSIRIYIANPNRHLLRSFDIDLDTLEKYELNHLFITKDSMLFDHRHDYSK